ncbi:MAG: hypothetical protein HZB29_00460 [Nitrospinae bacterium]|nr:hypothetical protein [Nitrospinota bacterium]
MNVDPPDVYCNRRMEKTTGQKAMNRQGSAIHKDSLQLLDLESVQFDILRRRFIAPAK